MRCSLACVLLLLSSPVISAPVPLPRPVVWLADFIDEPGGRTFIVRTEREPRLSIICKRGKPADVMYRPIRGLDGVNGLTPVGYVLSSAPATPHVGTWFAHDGAVIPYDAGIGQTLVRHLMQVQMVAFYITRSGEIDHGWIFDLSGLAEHRTAISRHCFNRR